MSATLIYRSHELRALKSNVTRLRAKIVHRKNFLQNFGENFRMPTYRLKRNIKKYEKLIKHLDIILTVEMTDI